MAQDRKPDKCITLGRIRVSIWLNSTDDGRVWANVEVTRAYREGNEWRHSPRFGRDDLPIVALIVSMAYAWIWRQTKSLPAESEPRTAEDRRAGETRPTTSGRAEPCK